MKLPLALLTTSVFVITVLILALNGVNLFGLIKNPMQASLLTVFLTGLIAGGLTCLAVQGGLLASAIASRTQEKLRQNVQKSGHALPLAAFIIAKLVAYTILGFLLGLLGSVFQLSLQARVILQFAVVIFMVGTALNLLEVHPVFRYFSIQPPRFITRFIRRESKSSDFFAPAFLGALTVFIPCGTTQAMMALSIATGSSLQGALIMFFFVLGTSPVFFILGYLTSRASSKMIKFAGVIILFLALYNLDGALALTGSNFSVSNLLARSPQIEDSSKILPVSSAQILIETNGYNPNVISVKKGSTVNLTLKNVDGYGCAQAFVIPSFNLQRIIPPGQNSTITLEIPDEIQNIPFMCSMGMYRGIIQVI